MIDAPHPLHTHIRSSLYIYIVCQHLIPWLVFIRMQPQPDVCWVSHSKCWQQESLLVFDLKYAVGYDWGTSFHFIPISGIHRTYMMCLITFYFDQWSYGCNLNLLYMLGLTVPVAVGDSDSVGLGLGHDVSHFQHLLLWLVGEWQYSSSWFLTGDNMIGTPRALHTYIRTTLDIYHVFDHLLLWLVVIRCNLNLIMLGLTFCLS